MIESFYTKTATNYRQEWTESSDIFSSAESEVGTFKCHVQQTSPALVENLGLNFTNTFSIYCADDTDVILGDRIVIDSDSYEVREIQNNNHARVNHHLEIVTQRSTGIGS